MIKLIKWQLREYRSPVFSVMLGLWLVAAVAAWLSYALLQLPLGTVVAVFRVVQWFVFLVIIVARYHETGVNSTVSTGDAGTLALHIPLPQLWGLLAKGLGILPLALGYIMINGIMFYLLPDDLPQLAELSPLQALFRATGPIFWTPVFMNWMIARARIRGVFLPSSRARFLRQYPKLRAMLCVWLTWMVSFALYFPCLVPAAIFWAELLDSGLPVPLQALLVAIAGLLLTVANSYLIEYYTPQLGPFA